VIHPSAGGSLPSWFIKRWVASQLTAVTLCQERFQSLRGLESWDEEDGRAVGNMLLNVTKAEVYHEKGETRVEARVRGLMENVKGLKEVGDRWAWFEVLLAGVAANKLRRARDSRAKLCNMSLKQAGVIGSALSLSIATNLTAPAAVDEWILRYPAMGEMDRE
jgi:hypothetical protein